MLEFWEWLKSSVKKKALRLGRRDLDVLAGVAIWPAIGGQLFPLHDLCNPPQRVARVLANSIVRPAREVRRSGLTVRRRASPRHLREVPTEEELTDWWDREKAGSNDPKDWHSVEAKLEKLLRYRRLVPLLEDIIGLDLVAKSEVGELVLRRRLIRASPKVERLQLLPRFLLSPESHGKSLDGLSKPQAVPTPTMVVETLANDSSNAEALHERIVALVAATDSESDAGLLARVSVLPIIPHEGRFDPPEALAFRSNRGDYWGDWKATLSTDGLSQELQKAFTCIGLTAGLPTIKSSRAFFVWLNSQTNRVIKDHVLQVLRHLQSSHGPRAWATQFPNLGVVATQFGEVFRLASLIEIRRRRVLIPDHIDLKEALLRDGQIGLAIAEAREIQTPLGNFLQSLGVQSLRTMAGPPSSVAPIGETTEDLPDEVRWAMATIQSKTFLKEVPKQLGRLGADLPGLLRRDYRERVREIGEVSMAEAIDATYTIGRKRVRTSRNGGFDKASGVLWLTKMLPDPVGMLAELVGADRVFRPEAEPVHHQSLRAVLYSGAIEVASYRQGPTREEDDQEDASQDDSIGSASGESRDAKTAVSGSHTRIQPDPRRNVPTTKPPPVRRPAPTARPSTSLGERRGARPGRSGAASRPAATEEQADKVWVKELYAFHRQRCLADAGADKLAPNGSYAEHAENREKLIEVHHADLVAAGGALHRGNMLALCYFHHQELGGVLSRHSITAALRHQGNSADPFGENQKFQAAVYQVAIPGVQSPVRLLFANGHRLEWLRLATNNARDE